MRNCTGKNCPIQIGKIDPATCSAHNCTWRTKPITNAERIRTMTVDELAKLMDALSMGDIDYGKTLCDMCNGQYECEDCCRWWLAQDADAYNGLNSYSIFYLPPRMDKGET